MIVGKCLFIAIVGYLLGSVSCGIIVGWAFGKMDIRSVGSKSTGTTNIMRTLGWLPSIITFLGDALKGFIAAYIGKWLGGQTGAQLGALFSVLGHNFPIFYGFKGGKGMATSFGVILALNPVIALILLCVQIIIVATTKLMSLASISTAALYFILVAISYFGNWDFVLFSLCISALAIWSHRSNITRLIENRENALDFHMISKISQKLKKGKK